MSTNGVVIIRVDDGIYAKIIADCNGMAAPELVRLLRGLDEFSLEELYKAALEADFGCRGCLVVMNSSRAIYCEDGFDDADQQLVADRYFDTYWNVSANARYPADNDPGWEYCETVWLPGVAQAKDKS
jgi:hypothetical protein